MKASNSIIDRITSLGYYLNLVLVILSITLIMNGCDNQQPNYYKKILITGKSEIIGCYSIDMEKESMTNYYHFIFDNSKKPILIEYIKSDNINSSMYEGIEMISIEYMDDIEIRHFKTKSGQPKKNFDGAYSRSIRIDKKNNSLLITNFNLSGDTMYDENLAAAYLCKTDNNRNIISSVRIDKNGNTISDNKPYEIKYEYDNFGWKSGESYFNKNTKPFINKGGYVKIKFLNDEFGNILEESYIGVDGKLVNVNDYAIKKYKYDHNGNMIEKSYFDSDNTFTSKGRGYAICRRSFNTEGKLTEKRFYDIFENLIEGCSKQASIIKYIYERNTIFILYYDKDMRFLEMDDHWMFNSGYSIEKVSFDNVGNVIESSLLDSSFTAYEKKSTYGFAKRKFKFDQLGNQIEDSYHDKHDRLKEWFGLAVAVSEYDDYGRKIVEQFYDSNNILWSIIKYKYDNDGRLIEESYHDELGVLKNSQSLKCAIQIHEYEENGIRKQTLFYDEKNQLVKIDHR
jgi:hypothetical protein